MPNFVSLKQVIDALKRFGFLVVSQKGSHVKYCAIISGKQMTVIVPVSKKEIPAGTFYSIVRQSGLTKGLFFER